MRRGVAGLLGWWKLLAPALVLPAVMSAPSEGGARPGPARVRYTVAVKYEGRFDFETRSQGTLAQRTTRVTRWEARSRPFAIVNPGTRSKPRYSFRHLRLAGPLHHRGTGKYFAGDIWTVGNCLRDARESETGRALARAAIVLTANRLVIALAADKRARAKIRLSGATCQQQVCDAASCKESDVIVPVTIPAWVESCSGKDCFAIPYSVESRPLPARSIKLGRAFTVRINHDAITDPRLHVQIPDGFRTGSYLWTLRFTPVSQVCRQQI